MTWIKRTSQDKPTVKSLSAENHGAFLEKICEIYAIPYMGNWVVDGKKIPEGSFEAIKKFNTDNAIRNEMMYSLAARQDWSGLEGSTFGMAGNFSRSAGSLYLALKKDYPNVDENLFAAELHNAQHRMKNDIDAIAKAHAIGSDLPPFGG